MISINSDITRITPLYMKPNCPLQSCINYYIEEDGRESGRKRTGLNSRIEEGEGVVHYQARWWQHVW